MSASHGFEINWIPLKCKWSSKCQACEALIFKGESIFWNKETRKVRHEKCLDSEFYQTMKQKQYWKGGNHR